MGNSGKSRLRKGISIVAAMVLLLNSIMPTVPVFADDSCEGHSVCVNNNAGYDALAEAISEAEAGSTINLAAGDYTLDKVSFTKNVTIVGASKDTVKISGPARCTDSNPNHISDANTKAGTLGANVTVKFENVTLDLGNGNCAGQGFQGESTSKLVVKDSLVKGRLTTFTETEFNNVIFDTTPSYNVDVHEGSNVDFTSCTFEGPNRNINVYDWNNHGDDNHNVTFTSCTFKTTLNTPKKGAINIHESHEGQDHTVKYNVTVTNADISEGIYPANTEVIWQDKDTNSYFVKKVMNGGLIMIDDIRRNITATEGDITVTVGDSVVYKTPATTANAGDELTVIKNWYENLGYSLTEITGDGEDKYTVNLRSYDVTFMDGTTELTALALEGVSHGAKITLPTAPEKVGYVFDKWYKESTFEHEWIVDTDTVTDATIIYAKYGCDTANGYHEDANEECVETTQPVEELVDIPAGTTATVSGSTDTIPDFANIEIVNTGDTISTPTTGDKTVLVQSDDVADMPEKTENVLENTLTQDLLSGSTTKKAAVQSVLDLTFLNVPVSGPRSPITGSVRFNKPIKLIFVVNTGVKIGAKHYGDAVYGWRGLTLNSQANCDDILNGSSTDGYMGTFITPIAGIVEIYTCEASSFVAYTEEDVQTTTPTTSGGGGGGGGSPSYSCKNLPDNAVANNKTKPTRKDVDYSYSTDTGAVCTFQCETGYARNEEASKCEKADGTEDILDTENDANTTSDTDASIEDLQKVLEDGYTQEFHNAYEFAFKNGITTMPSIEAASMKSPLTRIAMAKMLSNYAINVLGKTPDTSKTVSFPDVSDKLNADYGNGVTLAYQLGIMGINIDNFRPNDLVTRAEFGTALSRLLYGTADGEGAYYETHLKKLMDEKIITNADPKLRELRGYVMIMLMRSANS